MTRVAVVQAAAIPFDAEAATERTGELLAEAAAGGAKIAVFPEAFIGGYPRGSGFGATIGQRLEPGKELFRRYYDGAVALDGPELVTLAQAAREHGVFAVVGIIERSGNTLYCTVVMIDPEAGLVGHHRKLMPTGTERIVWGFGDGSTLGVVDSPAGKLGAVICWENYMPLLRQAMYAQGVEIYCAPTADHRPAWQSSMVHIATEGRVPVLSACQVMRVSDFPDDYVLDVEPPEDGVLMRGGSVIVSASGEVLAGPVYDEETILYAEIDRDLKTRGHIDFDPVGHYSRPDVFELRVDTRAKDGVVFEG